MTFPSSSQLGSWPTDIFITTDNTVYVVGQANDLIITWAKGISASQRIISRYVPYPYSIFATTAGDLYVSSGSSNPGVDRWTNNMTVSVPVMTMCDPCYDIFVDTDDNLFCSMTDRHQVVMRSLDDRPNTYAIVAGTSVAGSRSDMLEYPVGIFVTTVGDLYVADCGNDRVQLIRSGELNATTLADNKTAGAIGMSCPSAVVLDGSGYLFIVDQGNNRIIGSGPDGFRCVAGCSPQTGVWHWILKWAWSWIWSLSPGSRSDELNTPSSMVFDTYGNIFVADTNNSRIQTFKLTSNSCSKYDHMQSL